MATIRPNELETTGVDAPRSWLFVKKPMSMLLTEAGEAGEHSLKRTLGPARRARRHNKRRAANGARLGRHAAARNAGLSRQGRCHHELALAGVDPTGSHPAQRARHFRH